MNNEHPRLASVATILDDLVERVGEIGEHMNASGRESEAFDIFEVERSLRTAQRRLNSMVRKST